MMYHCPHQSKNPTRRRQLMPGDLKSGSKSISCSEEFRANLSALFLMFRNQHVFNIDRDRTSDTAAKKLKRVIFLGKPAFLQMWSHFRASAETKSRRFESNSPSVMRCPPPTWESHAPQVADGAERRKGDAWFAGTAGNRGRR